MTDVVSLRDRTDPFRARVAGALRRMVVKLTTKALWQVVGHKIDGASEVLSVEPFLGIGIAARPAPNGKPEAIVINLHDAQHPVAIAVRDERTRAAVASGLAADETALYNSVAIIHVKADGTIEARPVSGAAPVALALKSDIAAIKTVYDQHTHSGVSTGTAISAPPAVSFPAPVGTAFFKAR